MSAARLRVGLIDFLNAAPYHFGLEERLRDRDIEFVRGVPTELNAKLLAGEIDAAFVSSILAGRHADDLLVLPDHAIATEGEVLSVLLFSWEEDLRRLDGRRVALTSHSASSVELLRVVLRDRYDARPEFEAASPDLVRMLAGAEAALLIGDQALVEGHRRGPFEGPGGSRVRPAVFDLGQEWLDLTGLPFVFAVWAVRREAEALVREACFPAALSECKSRGLAARDALAAEFAARRDLPVEVCARYLHTLRYDLDDRARAGLDEFLLRALPEGSLRPLTYLEG